MNKALDSYLRMLAGPHEGRAGRFLDVRWPQPQLRSGMGKDYIPADQLEAAGALITGLAQRLDVYIGVALHDREAGDGSSVTRSHLAWADVDREDAQTVIDTFAHPPTMTVASGIICSRTVDGGSEPRDACRRHVSNGRGRLVVSAVVSPRTCGWRLR